MRVQATEVIENGVATGVAMVVFFESAHEVIALASIMGGMTAEIAAELANETPYAKQGFFKENLVRDVTYPIFDKLDDVIVEALQREGVYEPGTRTLTDKHAKREAVSNS